MDSGTLPVGVSLIWIEMGDVEGGYGKDAMHQPIVRQSDLGYNHMPNIVAQGSKAKGVGSDGDKMMKELHMGQIEGQGRQCGQPARAICPSIIILRCYSP